jgi:hypothetical protein
MHCKVSRLGEINRQQLKFQSAVQLGPFTWTRRMSVRGIIRLTRLFPSYYNPGRSYEC